MKKDMVQKVGLFFLTVFLCANVAFAAPVKLGTATGGLAIKYNNIDVSGPTGGPDGVISGYDEKPSNQAYTRAQYSYGNTNGMGFQFDSADLGGYSWNSIFSGQAVGSSQFGFDLFAPAATYNGGGGVTLPAIQFADYLGGGGASYAPVPGPSWAINDYKFGTPVGPGNSSNSNFNSLFRGTSFTMTTNSYSVTNDYLNGILRPRWIDIGISGTLVTDGFINWFNPTLLNTQLSTWLLDDTLLYTGTLRYDAFYGTYTDSRSTKTYPGSLLENGSDQLDLYEGSITLYAQTKSVPEPTTMLLLGFGLVGLAGIGRKFEKLGSSKFSRTTGSNRFSFL